MYSYLCSRIRHSLRNISKMSTSNATTLKTAFISGPLKPPPAYFATYYAPLITAAILQGHHFVMGPSRGIDTLALDYLLASRVPPSNITVFLSKTDKSMQGRYVASGVNIVLTGTSHTARDEACTRASDYDILRYMIEDEARAFYGAEYRPRVSGTEKNEIRRRDLANATEQADVQEAGSPLDEEAKQKRKIKRRIREARELEARMEAGETSEKNQISKFERLRKGDLDGWDA